jgi:cobalamin-dependent methionine synthase I
MSGRMQSLFKREEELARSLINPQGLYRIVKSDLLRKHYIFKDADLVAFGVCTIGEGLEKRVNMYFKEGEGTRGVILDAIGTVATEAVTELVNRDVEKWASENGYRFTRRFSPGYGPWDVRGQDLVFSHLGCFTAGVKLLPAKIMKPLKSVTFACKLGIGEMEEINRGRCSSCNMQGSCAYCRQGLNCNQAYVE